MGMEENGVSAIRRLRGIATFVAMLQLASPLHAKCTMEHLHAHGGKLAILNMSATLGEGDEEGEKGIWLGPLRVGQCVFDLALMTSPFVLANQKLLYVVTFSGSLAQVSLIDPLNCETKWTSEEYYGNEEFKPTHLRLARRKYPLDANCIPIQDPRRKKTPPVKAGAIQAEAEAKAEAEKAAALKPSPPPN